MKSQIQKISPLSYPIRLNIVSKYLGFILLLSCCFILVPLAASALWQEYELTFRYGVIEVIFLILGLLSLRIARPRKLQSNEALAIIALSFIIGSGAMVYPMMASGLSSIDAWFESVSALTTTGLSVAPLKEISNRTFFLARSWMQWYGGLGIIVFSLSLAFNPSLISRKFLKQVAGKDDMIENSKSFARKILLIYFSITILGIIVLKIAGLNWLLAAELVFASISTGGFSPFSDSIASLSTLVQFIITLLGFIGALSFPIFWFSSLSSVKAFFKDTQVRILALLCLIFALLLGFTFLSVPKGLINAVSVQTTTGFSTIEFSQIAAGSKFFLLSSMFIGGCTLSSAGGLKIIRFVILFQSLRLLFGRISASEKTVVQPADARTNDCLNIFVIYLLVIFISSGIFIAWGYPCLDSLFEVISATGTVGVSSGITQASLPPILKIVLGIDMLMGRLEMISLLVIFYPRTLFGRRNKT